MGQGVRNPIVVDGYGSPRRLVLQGFGPQPVHTGSAEVFAVHVVDAEGDFDAPVFTGTADLQAPHKLVAAQGTYVLEYVGDGSAVVVHAVQGEGTFEAPTYSGSASLAVGHAFHGQGFTGTPVFTGSADVSIGHAVAASGLFAPPVYTGSAALVVPHRIVMASGTFLAVDGGHAALVVHHLLAGSGTFAAPSGPSTLREAINAKLVSIPGLADRVTPYGRPQFQQGNAVTYSIVGRSFDHDLSGPSGVSTATLRVSAWSREYKQAEALAKSIRQSFDGFSGRIGGVFIMGCFLEDEGDLPEYPRNGTDAYLYQIVLTFTVIHRT
jgi:hypothetical protein